MAPRQSRLPKKTPSGDGAEWKKMLEFFKSARERIYFAWPNQAPHRLQQLR